MLKYFYKTFLVSVLSGSLATMNMLAYAVETSSPENIINEFNALQTKKSKPTYASLADALSSVEAPADKAEIQATYNLAEKRVSKGISIAISSAILKDFNDTRANKGLKGSADVDSLTANEKTQYNADMLASVNKIRVQNGFSTIAPAPNFPKIGVAGITEIHNQFVNTNTQNRAPKESVQIQGVGDSDMAATLMMVGGAMVAKNFLTYKKTIDVMIGIAGAAAFLAGEIVAFSGLDGATKSSQLEIERLSSGEIDQKQIVILEKLRQSLVDAKSTAGTKKKFQLASMAAFAAAGVAAYTLSTAEIAAYTSCNGAMSLVGETAATALKVALAATPVGTAAAAVATACLNPITIQAGGINTYEASHLPVAATMAQLPAVTTQNASLTTSNGIAGTACAPFGGVAMATMCQAYLTQHLANYSGGIPIAAVYQNSFPPTLRNILFSNPIDSQKISKIQSPANTHKFNFLDKITNFIMPSANASVFSLMGIGSAAAAALLVYNTSLGLQIDMFMLVPIKRAIVWAAFTALALAASKSTDNQIGIIEGNIKKIDNILNDLHKMDNSVASSNATTIRNPSITSTGIVNKPLNVNGDDNNDINFSGKNGETLPCLTQLVSGKCASFSDALTAQAQNSGLPSSVFDSIKLDSIGAMGQGLNGSGKISRATLGQVDNLRTQSSAVNKQLSKAQKDLQSKLNATGSKTNLAQAGKDLLSSLNKAGVGALAKSNTTPAALMASLGGGSGAASEALVDKDANRLSKTAGYKSGFTPASATGLSGNGYKAPAKDMDLDGKELAVNGGVGSDKIAVTMDDYDLKNDINKDKNSSIFEVISNRYLKSYERLFKRVK